MRMSSQTFGESYQPLSSEHLADPYSFHALARRQQPIFYNALLDAYVVTRFKDIHALLTNPKEMEVAFQTLTQRLPHLRLASPQTFEHEKTLMFRGYQRLFVEWD
jgi:cytochrome P450